AGAGAGTLARAVLAASPSCAPALRYVLVERSAALRARQAEHLTLESPAFAFAPSAGDDDDDEDVALPPVTGPIFVSLAELPRLAGPAIILANELLDNLPVDLAERTADGWFEVRVGVDESGSLAEVLVPCVVDPSGVVERGRIPLAASAVK